MIRGDGEVATPSSRVPHSVVGNIIENMAVRCRAQFERDDEATRTRGGGNSGDGSGDGDRASPARRCEWRGKLCDFKSHAKSSCPLMAPGPEPGRADAAAVAATEASSDEQGNGTDGSAMAIARKYVPSDAADPATAPGEGGGNNEVPSSPDEMAVMWRGETLLTDRALELRAEAGRILSRGQRPSSIGAVVVDGIEFEIPSSPETSPPPMRGGAKRPSPPSTKLSAGEKMPPPKPPPSNTVVADEAPPSSGKMLVAGEILRPPPSKPSPAGKTTASSSKPTPAGKGPPPLSRPKPEVAAETTPPSSRRRRVAARRVHDGDELACPRPWATNRANSRTPVRSNSDATMMASARDGGAVVGHDENDDDSTANKDRPSTGIDTVATKGGDKRRQLAKHRRVGSESDALLMAAVRLLVSEEVSKIRQVHNMATCEERPPSSSSSSSTQQRDSVAAMFVHRHLMDFCSSWMRRKPEALHDFVVYRPKMTTGRTESSSNGNDGGCIDKLLCGIPGPGRTCWEGGLYPVIFRWEDGVDAPPTCRFPRDFHHANVRPCGIVSLSTLKVTEWHPEISILELLFDLQQLLAHPDHDRPAQDDARDSHRGGVYDFKTTIQASLYSPSSLLETASSGMMDGFGPSASAWQLVDGEALLGHRQLGRARNPRPARPGVPAFESSLHGDGRLDGACKLRCSCCAWGQTIWDSRHEMRYLFGRGGS